MISVTDPVSKVIPSHHHAATITSMQICPDDQRTACAVTRTQTNVDTKLVIWHTPAAGILCRAANEPLAKFSQSRRRPLLLVESVYYCFYI